MDGPATSLKFFESLKSYRSQCELPKLFNINSCGHHIINRVFRSGTEATIWQLKPILRSSFNQLHESPVQRDDFTSHPGSNKFPMFFCTTRLVVQKNIRILLILLREK